MTDDVTPGALRIMIVLLSGTWMGTARLPRALASAGFRVASFCHEDSFLSKTRYAEYIFKAPTTGSAFPYLVNAVRQYRPELLIPGCELAVRFLQEIVRAGSDGRLGEAMSDVLALVQRSLGNPDYYHATLSKHETLQVAAELGLRAPQQSLVTGIEDAMRCADKYGFPLVLKGEFGFAGNEVRMCSTPDEVAAAYRSLSRGDNQRIVAQQYIRGAVAMQTALAVSGRVLESMTMLKERTHPQPAGPSSVIRFLENEESERATSLLIEKYGYTGFGSADFIIENDTQSAYLLEFNPRPVPACTLGWLFGRDLCRALWCHLSGIPYQRKPAAGGHQTVALFPNEWLRDPQSPFLSEAYHDVPWDDPLLLKALVQAYVNM